MTGSDSTVGKVYLVGAGPGDGELLTLKGDRVLSGAQVVVYDRLVSPEVLEKIPSGVERIDVGKNVGHHPVPQEEISRILLRKAREGLRVVRLKGGDNFLFGRGGEELELLAREGVPFEVVPGITSALAAPAYAGIPVTHRDFCSSVHIITGHRKDSGTLEIPYTHLAALGGTLIFLMSVASAGEIGRGLVEAGLSPETPCAVVENGTTPGQRKFTGVLKDLEEMIRTGGVKSPALIVVGEVCRLSGTLDWFSGLPLKGAGILITRPEGSAGKLTGLLRQLGARVVMAPLIRTVPLPFSWPDPALYQWILFTSPVGVRTALEALLESGSDVRALAGVRLGAVGRETAARLRQYGLTADFVPEVFSGQALGRSMTDQGLAGPGSRVLLLRAETADPELVSVLTAAGAVCDEVPVYRTETRALSRDPGEFDFLTFTSASCVRGFVESLGDRPVAGLPPAVCIGEQTGRAAAASGLQVLIAAEATMESLVEKLCEVYHAETSKKAAGER